MRNEHMDGIEDVATQEQIINSRELFYKPVNLEEDLIICGDDRDGPEGIHLFGGGLNVVYNAAILKETHEPDSVTNTFEEETHAIMPVLIEVAHSKPAVHSDTTTEGSEAFNVHQEQGAVGCAYALKRQAVSQHTFDNGVAILDRNVALFPELFTDEQDVAFARKVIAAHGRLASRDSFFPGGRKVVLAAVEDGAQAVVVRGSHDPKANGIINLVPNSALQSGMALAAGVPAYEQDAWAAIEINNRLRSLYPYDARQQQIAASLDTIGTMSALGIPLENVAVRRPE